MAISRYARSYIIAGVRLECFYQGMGGTGNPAGTGSARQADGPSQEIAGTLPNDFTLSGMKES